ncbi:secreted RxLR effector protein 161-like [Andrographis paniculata]|uniref:secreted RxLR effector protein 161-like n=1 Tax=Andrographis paniculata TaxID=175694 RepID=UPI0021E7F646|nr:secreted RxLR effector protein 161-like [Andrographis paniculata]
MAKEVSLINEVKCMLSHNFEMKDLGLADVILGMKILRQDEVLEGYCDADWISDAKDSLSINGYVFMIEGGVVSWKSTKQMCIARFTMESEFIALDKAGEEAEWLRNFMDDIPY